MGKKCIKVEVDFQLLERVEEILAEKGQTLQGEIAKFLQDIIDGREAFSYSFVLRDAVGEHTSLGDGARDNAGADAPNAHKYSKITEEMCEALWRAFLECVRNDKFDFTRATRNIEILSGMKQSSALLYLNFLRNICMGERNTRNIKIKDLRFFLGKIAIDLDDRAMANAKVSLKDSIPYWQEKIVGGYAVKVGDLLGEF